jgi:hypothetical protein
VTDKIEEYADCRAEESKKVEIQTWENQGRYGTVEELHARNAKDLRYSSQEPYIFSRHVSY